MRGWLAFLQSKETSGADRYSAARYSWFFFALVAKSVLLHAGKPTGTEGDALNVAELQNLCQQLLEQCLNQILFLSKAAVGQVSLQDKINLFSNSMALFIKKLLFVLNRDVVFELAAQVNKSINLVWLKVLYLSSSTCSLRSSPGR